MNTRELRKRLHRNLSLDQFKNMLAELGWRRSHPDRGDEVWLSPRIEYLPYWRDILSCEPDDLDDDRPAWLSINLQYDLVKIAETVASRHEMSVEELVEKIGQHPDNEDWRDTQYRAEMDKGHPNYIDETGKCRPERCEAMMLFAVQNGNRQIIWHEGDLFEKLQHIGVNHEDPDDLFMHWPDHVDSDGLWKVDGELVYDDGRRLRRPDVEPEYRFEGESYKVLPAQEVSFPRMGRYEAHDGQMTAEQINAYLDDREGWEYGFPGDLHNGSPPTSTEDVDRSSDLDPPQQFRWEHPDLEDHADLSNPVWVKRYNPEVCLSTIAEVEGESLLAIYHEILNLESREES